MLQTLRLLTLAAIVAALAAAEPTRLAIANGGMDQGGAKPDHWSESWTGRGTITVSRDTVVFKQGPASLCVATTGDAQGNGFQMIDVPGGATIAVTGWIKTEGKLRVNVFAQSFTADWQPIDFTQIAYRHDNAAYDWSEFTGSVTLPPGATRVGVGILVEGTGKAWLDEVRDVRDAKADPGVAGGDLTAGPPAKDKPDVPGWGFYPNFPTAWAARHRDFIARTKQGGIDVVFFGDSLTQGWGEVGKASWDAHFAGLNAVNYGIGGDSTRQVLWRIANGELDGLSPKVVVVAIGTNNLYDDGNAGSDAEISEGVAAVVTALRTRLPTTKVLLLGLMPRQNSGFCGRISAINATLAAFDDGKDVRYLDAGASFLVEPGTVKAELYKQDQFHLDAPGYVVWAERIVPLLTAMVTRP